MKEGMLIRQLAGKKAGLTRKLNDLALAGKHNSGSFKSLVKQIKALEKELRTAKAHHLSKTRQDWHMPQIAGSENVVDETRRNQVYRKQHTYKSYKGTKDAKEMGSYVEALHKRLYDKRGGAKIKSRLIKKKKTAIAGFSYWFKK